ncbi:ABC transporter ATP-binding protein [Desulfovibrio sp. Fe33]|uniref:ABC transporter ATP-binding protein n=1 Tax=Desulfovibrio sp. Fe33 TaxID=3020842 RepID=UPI00234CD569|nr:ABC transporter ATP-binding protein [Desulfovibrio sp. Fe33]
MGSQNTPLLEATDLQKRFGGIQAVTDYSLTLTPGELVGLIGPNGAGKTTVFNLLTGVLPPTDGSIVFDGKDITRCKATNTARSGMARTFQNIRIFQSMTVLDNIKVGFHNGAGCGFWQTLLHTPAFRQSEREIEEQAVKLAGILGIEQHLRTIASTLSYGDLRRLEIARALALRPKLLLLDEPAAGMNPQETQDLMQVIRHVNREFELAILLVEHDMPFVMNLCQRLQVLNYGQLLTEGTPEEVQNNPDVIKAYLGSETGSRK